MSIKFRPILTIVVAWTSSCWAATITVCASGCTYTTMQAAITASVRGDFIEPKAGETFEGDNILPLKDGAGVITVRSSRWRELPPPGHRITSAHASLMPKLQQATTLPAISTGETENVALSMNASTDVMTFASSHGWSAGDPIACYSYQTGINVGTPIPTVNNQIYYVLNPSGATLQLANTPGGAAIDWAGSPWPAESGSAPMWSYRCTLAKAVSGWKFQGIEFAQKPGQFAYNLVTIGEGQAKNRVAIPNDFTFDRVYIHGTENENGPRNCLVINVGTFSITDSRLEHCQENANESHAISGVQAQGPILIRNNYLAAGSVNIMFGGGYVLIPGLVNGDRGGITFEGNLSTRPWTMKYLSGTGGASDPAGACTNDTYYLNTTSGVLFLCASLAWVAAPTPAWDYRGGEYYRRTDVTQNCASGACWQATSGGIYATSSVYRQYGYYTKNNFEMKSVANMRTFGNIFENTWNAADQKGESVWACSLVNQGDATPWATCRNSEFSYNILRNAQSGLRLATNAHTDLIYPISRYNIHNNLGYNLAEVTGYPSINAPGFSSQNTVSFAGYIDDSNFDHNTFYSGAFATGNDLVFDGRPGRRVRLSNNIGNQRNGVNIYDGGIGCLPYLPVPSFMYNNVHRGSGAGAIPDSDPCSTNATRASDATDLFADPTTPAGFRLLATSPYSASCSSGCAYTGTDGKDPGPDIDMVEAATCGAESGAPCLGNSVQVTAGSTRAIVRYTAPSASACNLKLYADAGRATLHGDTADSAKWVDSRAGNLTNGTSRQFVLGSITTLTASTEYQAVINCSGSIGYARFRTTATGAGYNAVTSYSSARTGEYSSSADMSSPTAITSSATHTVPVPSASVRYYRATGGAIRAFVSP